MHMTSRCIMCSDVDFLCKCLNLLYVIKGDDFLWPGPQQLPYVCVCVPHAVALWFSFSQRTHTLSFFFVPSLHGVYCSTLEIKPPGESQPNIAAACTKFIDWEEECCERECGEGSGPGRQAEQISWHLLYARNLHPLLWVEHIHYFIFFKETSSAVWLFYLLKKKKKSLASSFFLQKLTLELLLIYWEHSLFLRGRR